MSKSNRRGDCERCGCAAPLYPAVAGNGMLEWQCGLCHMTEFGNRTQDFWITAKAEARKYPQIHAANLREIEVAEPHRQGRP